MVEPVKCAYCDKTFKNRSAMMRHVRVVHKEILDKIKIMVENGYVPDEIKGVSSNLQPQKSSFSMDPLDEVNNQLGSMLKGEINNNRLEYMNEVLLDKIDRLKNKEKYSAQDNVSSVAKSYEGIIQMLIQNIQENQAQYREALENAPMPEEQKDFLGSILSNPEAINGILKMIMPKGGSVGK